MQCAPLGFWHLKVLHCVAFLELLLGHTPVMTPNLNISMHTLAALTHLNGARLEHAHSCHHVSALCRSIYAPFCLLIPNRCACS
jgi:hypothetical protein